MSEENKFPVYSAGFARDGGDVSLTNKLFWDRKKAQKYTDKLNKRRDEFKRALGHYIVVRLDGEWSRDEIPHRIDDIMDDLVDRGIPTSIATAIQDRLETERNNTNKWKDRYDKLMEGSSDD